MKFTRSFALGIALLAAVPAEAATIIDRLDVTVTTPPMNGFAAPIFRYYNLSSPGIDVTRVRMSGGAPWDYVLLQSPYAPVNPAGGSRTRLEGEERDFNPNNGCTAGINYGYSSFNPGDVAGFVADPESGGCGNAVVDVRPFLNGDIINIEAVFSDGATLSGHDWTMELINPLGSPTNADNQLFRLTLERVMNVPAGVPEPSVWMMLIAGFGLIGAALRRRTAGRPAAV